MAWQQDFISSFSGEEAHLVNIINPLLIPAAIWLNRQDLNSDNTSRCISMEVGDFAGSHTHTRDYRQLVTDEEGQLFSPSGELTHCLSLKSSTHKQHSADSAGDSYIFMHLYVHKYV